MPQKSRGIEVSLNAERSELYPEPRANHFQLDPEEVLLGARLELGSLDGARPVCVIFSS